ncbi:MULTISPECIES: nuclear transport factor 2 family protein [Lactobacillaceae]|uniref:nuclear transport factor 2 family protein n=1 Tax=Lactobacillaceae TaxID=33958 RepID=UPI001B3B22D7|nr:nuclear transport factor 2 family protein [Lactobacillus sp. HBUAS51381]
MPDLTLPAAIATFISATNAADSDQFVAQFTTDAVLNDWGTEYHGPTEIAKWNQTDNIGKQSHYQPPLTKVRGLREQHLKML